MNKLYFLIICCLSVSYSYCQDNVELHKLVKTGNITLGKIIDIYKAGDIEKYKYEFYLNDIKYEDITHFDYYRNYGVSLPLGEFIYVIYNTKNPEINFDYQYLKSLNIEFDSVLYKTQKDSLWNREFEGIALYNIEIKNPVPSLISDSIFYSKLKRIVSTQKYYYKDKYYKSILDGDRLFYQIYSPKDSKLYSFYDKSDTASVSDCKHNEEKITETILEDSDTIIYNIMCKKVTFKLNSGGEMIFFFNPYYFKLNPEKFKGHKLGFWYDYLKVSNSLPIKYIIKKPFLNMEVTLVDVTMRNISEKEFAIPHFKHKFPRKTDTK